MNIRPTRTKMLLAGVVFAVATAAALFTSYFSDEARVQRFAAKQLEAMGCEDPDFVRIGSKRLADYRHQINALSTCDDGTVRSDEWIVDMRSNVEAASLDYEWYMPRDTAGKAIQLLEEGDNWGVDGFHVKGGPIELPDGAVKRYGS